MGALVPLVSDDRNAAWTDDIPDHDLLAEIVGRTVAPRLMRRFGSLNALAQVGDADLLAARVSPVKVRLIRAAIELGHRSLAAPVVGDLFDRPEPVARHFVARIGHKPVEEFHVLALSVRHRVTGEFLVARGTLTGVEVHPREVFRPLIKVGAAGAIAAHNHPSGDESPSHQDLDLTERLRQVGELIGIPLLDHVIVTTRGWCSALRP